MVPPQDTRHHQDDIAFVVGNPINLHLPLLLGGGTTQPIHFPFSGWSNLPLILKNIYNPSMKIQTFLSNTISQISRPTSPRNQSQPVQFYLEKTMSKKQHIPFFSPTSTPNQDLLCSPTIPAQSFVKGRQFCEFTSPKTISQPSQNWDSKIQNLKMYIFFIYPSPRDQWQLKVCFSGFPILKKCNVILASWCWGVDLRFISPWFSSLHQKGLRYLKGLRENLPPK